jgi:hypothetical protein
VTDVGLRHGQATAEQVPEVAPGVEPFAGGQRNGAGLRQQSEIGRVLGQDGLLHEQRQVRLEQRQQAPGHRGGGPAVQVDHHVVVQPDRLAYGGHPLDDLVGPRRRLDRPELGRPVHLDRGEAGLDLRPGQLGDVGRPVAADPRVHPDPVAHRAAEQGVHRPAVRLAGDVPQRLVDAGDRAGQDRAAAVEAALGEHLPVVLDAQRVSADEMVAELGDRGPYGFRPALHHRLAPAGDALVGPHAQEEPAGRDQEGVQRNDLHACHLFCSARVRRRWSKCSSHRRRRGRRR